MPTPEEKIIQIAIYEKYIIALTNKGNIFKRYMIHDKAESYWASLDLPDFNEVPIEREKKNKHE